ncbi:radical SAM protein [Selenomonas ruminantium]|uniref:Putative pyruvate formate lyase activating enzyme n=1 Tax=Selenomonas ruminantium TaxID=971 RepID=A0A1H0UHZ6_SELRU|nr:radical SAM protein [Selenomonas ruminantium]SDP65608.1 putative pyruvate formate lyase activating enzyme [Selenomonas ruminantium]
MLDITHCNLCPRRCGVNRTQRAGFCGAGDKVRIALVSLHQWEEPCLVGEKGAGTVFFSYCSLRCVYCQNHEISHGGKGQEVTVERLAEIFLEQQARGAATLDLVTPTHYVPQIIEALDRAKSKGFALPVVYNSSGYETVETIEALRGYVDIFLPDLKYREEASGSEYSAAADYFACASEAIKKMVEITGPVQFADNGQMKKGVLVRHMVLPGHRHESMALVKWLWENFGKNIQVSLMSQYTPMYKASEHKKINRRLTTFEYESVVDYALSLGLENAYVQERRSASEEYVPDFNGTGVQQPR